MRTLIACVPIEVTHHQVKDTKYQRLTNILHHCLWKLSKGPEFQKYYPNFGLRTRTLDTAPYCPTVENMQLGGASCCVCNNCSTAQ